VLKQFYKKNGVNFFFAEKRKDETKINKEKNMLKQLK